MMEAATKQFDIAVFSHPTYVKELVKAIVHTIFFHRMFHAVRPIDRDLLGITLAAVDDANLETLIEQRVVTLVRQMETAGQTTSHVPETTNGRARLSVLFFEKRRKKSYFAFGKGDEEVCWEQWDVDVTVAKPKNDIESNKVREAMETSLQNAALKIVSIASRERNHIPPITTSDAPFPYQIEVCKEGWAKGIGLF